MHSLPPLYGRVRVLSFQVLLVLDLVLRYQLGPPTPPADAAGTVTDSCPKDQPIPLPVLPLQLRGNVPQGIPTLLGEVLVAQGHSRLVRERPAADHALTLAAGPCRVHLSLHLSRLMDD